MKHSSEVLALCLACNNPATLSIWADILKVDITLCRECVTELNPRNIESWEGVKGSSDLLDK